MLNPSQKQNLTAAATAAVACEAASKLPAELTVAQWADESGWGAHQPGNNCFGIKAAKGTPGEPLATTEYLHSSQQPVTEDQTFQVFPTLGDCFNRHAELITTCKPYAASWAQYLKDKNWRNLTERVAKSYATDPMYGVKLARIATMPDVQAALAEARKPLVQIKTA